MQIHALEKGACSQDLNAGTLETRTCLRLGSQNSQRDTGIIVLHPYAVAIKTAFKVHVSNEYAGRTASWALLILSL